METITGSVQSSNLPTAFNTKKVVDNRLYRAMVIRTIYVDDSDNLTQNSNNPRVLYDVVILGGFQSGQIISNCRLSESLGGTYNCEEVVLKASTKSLNEVPLNQHDGDVVLIEFIQGDTGAAQIIRCDRGMNTSKFVGAKRSDGIRFKRQFNGVVEEIDKNGNRSVTYKSGELQEDGSFVPSDEVVYKIEVTKGQLVKETFKSGMTITKDGDAELVEIDTGKAVVQINGKSGTVTINGDVSINGQLDVQKDIKSSTGSISATLGEVSAFSVATGVIALTGHTHATAAPGTPSPPIPLPAPTP